MEELLGLVLMYACLGIVVAIVTAAYFPACFQYCTAPILKPLAVCRIRYYVRNSTTFPKDKRFRRFSRRARDQVTPCASPVSDLLSTWLSGNQALDVVEFSGLSSYVLSIPADWG
jgi:hypothetical protein